MPKFTIEDHEKRIRDILARRGQVGNLPTSQRSNVLQNLLDKARLKTKGKPREVEEGV